MKIKIPERIKEMIEVMVKEELEKNFLEGGRYGEGKFGGGTNKWKPSLRVIKKGGRTLIDTGRLKTSVGAIVEDDELVLHASNVEYAKDLQEGTEKMVARPFLTLPDDFEKEVWKEIGKNLDKLKVPIQAIIGLKLNI